VCYRRSLTCVSSLHCLVFCFAAEGIAVCQSFSRISIFRFLSCSPARRSSCFWFWLRLRAVFVAAIIPVCCSRRSSLAWFSKSWVASPMSRKRALSPPSTSEIELFRSCVLNHRWVFLGLLPSQLVQPAHGGSWVVNRVHLFREQRGKL
jgi:hypothetical protein